MTRRTGLRLDVARSVALFLATMIAGITFPTIVRARAARSQAAAQPAVETAKFDVASIRVNREISDRPTLLRPILQPGGRVVMRNQSLSDLILTAYGINENELIGGPDWVRSTGFDVEGRGTADMSAATARAMLRALLAERFSLQVHRELRERPVYVLSMAAGNGQPDVQLKPAAVECVPVTRPAGMPAPAPPPKAVMDAVPLMVDGAPPRCPSISLPGHFSRRATSMDALASELADVVGRLVVNRTGLSGEFDFELRYTPDLNAHAAPDPAAPPALMTALREQLGVKLEASRGPVEVLVIDRALMPTGN
jgi:uncharacterized protein (TIGR03435 family)